MEFIKTVALRGANRWASHSVIEAHFDGGAWARRAPSRGPELVAALRALRGAFELVVAQPSLLARQHDSATPDLVERLYAQLEHDGIGPTLAQPSFLEHRSRPPRDGGALLAERHPTPTLGVTDAGATDLA